MRSVAALTRVDPGCRVAHALTLAVNLPEAGYRESARQRQYYPQAIEAAAALPGVRAAAVVSALPFSGTNAAHALVTAEGEAPWGAVEGDRHRVEVLYVSADYFRAMGIPFLERSTFSDGRAVGGNRGAA